MPADRPKLPSHRKSIALGSLFAFVLIVVAGRLTPSISPEAEGGPALEAEQVTYTTVAQMRLAALWDQRAGPAARLVRFDPGAATPPHSHSGSYLGLLISGSMKNPFAVGEDTPTMNSGTYWYVPAGTQHVSACVSENPCLAYLRFVQRDVPE